MVWKPAERAGVDVERADVAVGGGEAFGLSAADDEEVLEDDAGGSEADGLLFRVALEALMEVDAAGGSEGGDGSAGFGVEGIDVATEGGEDAGVTRVGIEGHAADALAGGLGIEGPDGFAGGGVERDDVSGRGVAVEDSVDDDGLCLEGAASAGVVGPGGLEAGDIGAVDLFERGIAGAFGIAAVGGPFLGDGRGNGEQGEDEKSGGHRLN